MAKADIEKEAEKLISPILTERSFELVDMEYVKEGSDWFLRAYIDKEGGIDIDDCENVSRAFEEKLDSADLIPDAYILEVSSPGLTRPLKKERDYIRNMGKLIEIHLYKPVDGCKQFIGTLEGYDEDSVTIKEDGNAMTFAKKDISIIRQYFEF